MKRVTESSSNHNDLELKSTRDLLVGINQEDQTVAMAVEKEIDQIELLVDATVERMQRGGRLFYMGAGTSGRLGIVDASECPPTFGVPHGMVIGIIAGGDQAIRKAVEFAEDDREQGWKDLMAFEINENDVVIGIAASGSTPYVLGAFKSISRYCNHSSCRSRICNWKYPYEKWNCAKISVEHAFYSHYDPFGKSKRKSHG
jgi:N-acetylmuramic acid 6-phosphate etherase